MNIKDMPIGFFDSGVGGLSVLKEAVKLMPYENFIYFGDSVNAPYGTKTVEEVKDLTFKAVTFLIGKGVKAVVIACNTATSAAIEDLREKYIDIPVIGIEPALKPAVELNRKGKVIIMATPLTLVETKFYNLMEGYKKETDIVPLPCDGLAELVESGATDGEIVNTYLKSTLGGLLSEDIAAVVLGCTHYPFVAGELAKLMPKDTPIIDGSLGTSKQLMRQLQKKGLLREETVQGKVEIINSLENKEIIELSYKLLRL